MAESNVLGVQATINGQEVRRGADNFIAQIGRMDTAANNFMRGFANKSKMVKGEVVGIEETFDKLVGVVKKGAAAMGIAFGAQQFTSQVMKVRGEFQQLEVAFNTMLGSAEKASSLMQEVIQMAAVTPFGLQEVAGGTKQLLAYGIAPEEAIDTLRRLGDISAGLTIPLNDLVYLYGTTMTQGRMFTQDLRQFQGRGIPLAEELAKQFGVTKDKVGELVTAGKVGFEEMKKGIISMTSEGGKFGGLMEAQSKTITGQMRNIEDAIDGMFNEIGKSSEGIINTGLGAVSALVENYEKVGEAIGVAVTAYGAYKAALMTGMAVQKAEAAITAEAAAQKSVAALAGRNLIAAQARGVTMSQLYAAAQAKVVLSLKALASATILNPYVLAAAAITGVVYGIYKLATAETEAEKITKRYNKAVEESAKEHEKQRKEVDDLVSSLGDLELTEATRYRNFLKLKETYPDILKDIDDENEFLREKHRILTLINEEQAKGRQQTNKGNLADAEQLYNELLTKGVKTVLRVKTLNGQEAVSETYRKATQAELDTALANVNDAKKNVAEAEIDQFLKGVGDMKIEDISSTLNEITTVIQALEGAGDNAIGIMGGISDEVFEFTKSQLKTVKTALETEKDARGGTQRTSSGWLAQYKKEWEAAEKELKDFMKKREELSEVEFERQYKELAEKRDTAKKKYEDAGGSTRSTSKSEEDRAKEILKIQRQNQQDQVNLMKDGSAKRIAQINLEHQRELEAYEEAKKKYGEIEEVKAMKNNIDLKYQKALSDERKESLREELQAMYDNLQEYDTIQKQKYAIAKKYDEMIAAEADGTRKKMLEGEKQSKMSSMDANELAMGIDWGSTFEGVGNILGDIAKETLTKVEEYMKTSEFKNLNADDKRAYTDLREKLKQEVGGGTSPFNFKQWEEIAEQVNGYRSAVETLKYASQAHATAIQNLKDAENELKNATTDTAKEIAQQKVDLAKKTVKSTGDNLKNAQDNEANSKNNLANSTEEAVKGIDNFTSYLNEMSNGSLYGFANGVTKLVQTLTKGSDAAAEGLAGLGKAGGIVGAILQILGALGDNPTRFFDDLLKSIADALSNLIADLPDVIGTILERAVDIVGGVLSGIGSWIGLDTTGESDKNLHNDIERLTSVNELLINAVDKLADEMANASVVESKEMYEQQKSYLNDTMNNVQEMMMRSAKAYSNGFLGIGGDHSSNYYVNQAMNKEGFLLQGYNESQAEFMASMGEKSTALWDKVSEVVGFSVTSASEFFALSSENMAKVARDAPEIYSLIKSAADDGHENAAQYMDEYIQYYEQLQELENQYREKITGISFDSLKSEFKDLLMDMESDAEDFAQAFEKMMKNAIVEAFILENFKGKLQQFYTNFANAMESDGKIDETEQAQLRKEWQGYADEAIAERDALWQTMGWDESSYSQEASGKGFQAMSQDTAEELNGRFTALQVAGEEIRNQVSQQTILQQLISTDTSLIRAEIATQNQYISEIVDIQYESVGFLSEISKNTKQLFEMNEKLGRIEENTRNI